ncbi:MAG: hypothetical protein ACTSXU_11810, partial [Promethearchaeota archaeon]
MKAMNDKKVFINFRNVITLSLYNAACLIMIFHEKFVFSSNFREVGDYLILLGIILITFISISLFSRYMARDLLRLALFLISLVLALYWFIVFSTSPVNFIASSYTYLINDKPWHELVFTLTFSTYLPLFFRLNAKTGDHSGNGNNAFLSLLSGGLILISGTLSWINYYWSLFIEFVIWLIIGISFLIPTKGSEDGRDDLKRSINIEKGIHPSWNIFRFISRMIIFLV